MLIFFLLKKKSIMLSNKYNHKLKLIFYLVSTARFRVLQFYRAISPIKISQQRERIIIQIITKNKMFNGSYYKAANIWIRYFLVKAVLSLTWFNRKEWNKIISSNNTVNKVYWEKEYMTRWSICASPRVWIHSDIIIRLYNRTIY